MRSYGILKGKISGFGQEYPMDNRSDFSLKHKLIKIALDYVSALLVLLFIIFLLPKLLIYFLPFVIGYIISVAANPIVHFLEKKVKIVRKHSTAVIIILTIAALIGLIYFGALILITQFKSLSNDLPEMIDSYKEQFDEIGNKFNKLYDHMPAFLQGYLINIRQLLGGAPKSSVTGTSPAISYTWAKNTFKNILEIFISIFFAILSAYFFTADHDELSNGFKKLVSKSVYDRIELISNNFKKAVGGYFKAQFKIMIVLLGIMYITLKLLGVHYSFLISLGTCFLDLLPIFGTGAVLWPWAIYRFLLGDYFMGAALLVLYVVCQIVKQFLQPKVVGDSLGLNPLLTLFLLFIGYRIGGVIGILIALPAGLIVINLYRSGAFDVLIKDAEFIRKCMDEFNRKNS